MFPNVEMPTAKEPIDKDLHGGRGALKGVI
jgi:hypothetical protein